MTHDDKQLMQQLFETQTLQFQRYLSVVSENFDHKIGLIAEGHESLNQKIDNLAQKTEERFDLVDFKIDALNQKVDGVTADLKATDERLSHKIDGVAADLKVTDERLGGKIDSVAADLKAHRADTEAHQVYRVKEG